jgi:F-type H+-transporting ATPase subunit b
MMFGLMTNFAAEEASGIGALGFDGKAFLIQLITFILAYLVLRRYAFGPILEVLRRRRETIESSVKLTEDLQKEKDKLEATVEKTLHEARAQADGMIAGANDTARQMVRDAEDKAKTKAEGVMKSAESRIAQDTARARTQLQGELVGLVSEATEAIIKEKVDSEKDTQLIKQALKERQTA